LYVGGFDPVLTAWSALRPAHAWLNLVGFVSLIVVGTLLHLLPTVAGTRIVDRLSGRAAVGGLAVGVPLVAGGLLLAALGAPRIAADAAARAGAALVLVGAAAIVAEVLAVVRVRGRWTTDHAWHAMALGSLAAGTGWAAIGLGLAGVRALEVGAGPDAWATPLVGAPLAIGWVVQVLVGAWTHLIPAIGPGGPAGHATRRDVLGRAAAGRLAALNAGVVLLTAGWGFGVDGAAAAGAVLLATALVADIVLAIAAIAARSGGAAGSGMVARVA
jgi:nitrite reductase (NO-forming)